MALRGNPRMRDLATREDIILAAATCKLFEPSSSAQQEGLGKK